MSHELDEITCKRAGTLAAYGFSDRRIADALLLSDEQMAFALCSEIFQQTKAQYLLERAEKAQTLSEGWDAIEERAMEKVLTALEYNVDPRYALQAARMANQAHRRTGAAQDRIIDTSKAGNVIQLTMNKTYIERQVVNTGGAVLDVSPRENRPALPRKQADVPTPKTVSELLSPARRKAAQVGQELSWFDGLQMGDDE